MKEKKRDLVLDTVDDLVACFLYYDRKEDENLPRGVIEKAIAGGVISVDEIVERFRSQLTESLPESEM